MSKTKPKPNQKKSKKKTTPYFFFIYLKNKKTIKNYSIKTVMK